MHDRWARRAAVAAGALMPIYQVGNLPPWTIRLALALLLAVMGIGLATHRRFPRFDVWWSLLFASLAFSTLLTWSAGGWSRLIGFIAGAAVGLLLVDDKHTRRNLLIGFAGGSAVSASVALLAFVGGPDLQAPAIQREGVWGFSYGSPAFGYSCAMGLAIVLWYRIPLTNGRWHLVGTITPIFLLSAGLLVGSGRGGLVAAIISAPLLSLIASRRSSNVRKFIVLWAGLFVASLFFFTTPTLDRFDLGRAPDLDTFSAGRLSIYDSGWSQFMDGPILTGQGMDVALEVSGPWSLIGPHNALLALALGGGLVALIAGVAIYGRGLTLARRALRADQPESHLMVAVLLVGMVRGFFEVPGSIAGGAESILFVMAYGVLTHNYSHPSRLPTHSQWPGERLS